MNSTVGGPIVTDGNCSLRDAIQAANTDNVVDACPAGNGQDAIRTPVGFTTLSFESAVPDMDSNRDENLDILDSVTIQDMGCLQLF